MPKIFKTGIVSSEMLSDEIYNIYDTNIYTEPDGSTWIRIAHHNNPANAKFASDDTFSTQVYKDADRWFNVSLCNGLSNAWELMVKQKTTTNATEAKYRWIQYTNPMLTWQFNNTKEANVTKITTSGYSTASSYGGAYILNSNTYICINNGTNGNWFGAFGCWGVFGGGIPGYGGSAVTTGYMDLYLRVGLNTSFNSTLLKSQELIEI